MKPGVRLLRLFILLVVFPVSYSNAVANTISASATKSLAAPVINLTVGTLPGIAQLSWTTTIDPLLDGTYFVERQIAPSPTWDLLTQLPFDALFEYQDTISYPYCDDTTFSYRIRFESIPPGTPVESNTVNEVLRDQTLPANAQNIVVSILPNPRFPIITWTPVPVLSDDIYGYEIQRFDGGPAPIPIVTVPADTNRFVDQTIKDACDKSYAYAIVTIDRCGRRSTPSYYPLMQTINLNFPIIDDCERLAKLSWNPYNLMPGGLGGYKVYRMVDWALPAVEITTLPGADTTYTDAYQFVKGHFYTYYVQAFNSSGTFTSSSCQKASTFTGKALPDLVYITSVSVVADSNIYIGFHSSPESSVKQMMLERSMDEGATWATIDSMDFSNAYLPQDSIFVDKTADVHSRSYSYRLLAIDICRTTKLYSNISRSVFLQCSGSPTQNTIDWNGYESWLQGIEGYRVFRTVGGQPVTGDSIANVTDSTLTFPDLLANVDPTKEVCYWVKAMENPGNPYLVNATSVSNTCCITKGATLFMPNAFRPGGNNNRFRPVATFVDPQHFKMTIFNRWGQQVFETSDMVNGWNGLINGQLAPLGLYAYIITYSSLGGEAYAKRGTVFIVR